MGRIDGHYESITGHGTEGVRPSAPVGASGSDRIEDVDDGSDDGGSPSEIGYGSGLAGSSRERGRKWNKERLNRKVERELVYQILDGILGEIAKVRKVATDFGE